MSWVTVIWSMVASACLTLAGIHLLVWCQRRTAWANLMFTLTAAGVAIYAGVELRMMRAATPTQFASDLRWLHVPTWLIVLSLVGFVRVYLHAGRPWLVWAVGGLRSLALLLNFLVGQNLNYRQVTGLRHISFLGESVSLGVGVSNPFMLVGQLSLLLFVVFTLDATITVWRRGDRRLALATGGSIVFFALTGFVQAVLVLWQIVDMPLTESFFFLGIVVAMAYEMSRETLRAAQLSEELLESQQRMGLAASAADLSLWEWDIARDQIWTSEKGRARAGFGVSEHISFARFLQSVHPDDREQTERVVRHALEADGDYEAEYRVVARDGAARWIAAHGQVERNADGKPLRMRGVSVDITQRRHSEDALRESEARFRTVADAAPVMIWMSGPNKLCEFFNKGWLDFTGHTLEQELGDGWAKGVHPDDLAWCLKTYVQSFDARRPFTMEYRLRRHDDKYRWMLDHGVPRYDPAQKFLGYIGSCIDLTERRSADERFRLAVEASPSGIVLVNDAGRMVLVSPHVEKLFGYSREELIGQTVEKLIPGRFRGAHPGLRASFHTVPKARAMGAGRELFALRKDGSEFQVEVGLSPIHSEEGILVLTTIVDITSRKQAEAELRRLQGELAHVSRVSTMGQLASSLAHELNQPLGAIMRNAEAAELLLQHEAPDLEEVRAILSDICKDDLRAGVVIDRLRGYLKRGEVQRQSLDLKALLADVLALVRLDAEIHRVRVALESAPGLPPIQGDRVQLQQVMVNLLLNAMDALMAKPVENRSVTVQTRTLSDKVEVTVSDNGPGIPPDKLVKVFEPFFTSKPKGLGMGLAISRGIIEAHGGRLWAENNPGGGAALRFNLPAAVNSPELGQTTDH